MHTPSIELGGRSPRVDIAARARRFCVVLSWVAFVMTAGAVSAAKADSNVRIAIAPFGGDWESPGVAQMLSARIAERPISRLIAPDAFLATTDFDATAAQVRQWAYNAAVDTVIVGRLSRPATKDDRQEFEIEVALRSGHSGAEFSRRRIGVQQLDSVEESLERLASVILSDLGYTPADSAEDGPHRDPRSPEPAPRVAPPNEDAAGEAESNFELGQLREDQPIEINAEEAEIVDRGTDRRLIFQRNVRVKQGDIRLASDSLEAEYRKGEPEPDRLIARGKVEVDQGYRRARCDRAVYLRLEQKISCEGHAELVQGCDVVRGEAIEFDLAGDQAQVIGAASIVIRPSDENGRACTPSESTL